MPIVSNKSGHRSDTCTRDGTFWGAPLCRWRYRSNPVNHQTRRPDARRHTMMMDRITVLFITGVLDNRFRHGLPEIHTYVCRMRDVSGQPLFSRHSLIDDFYSAFPDVEFDARQSDWLKIDRLLLCEQDVDESWLIIVQNVNRSKWSIEIFIFFFVKRYKFRLDSIYLRWQCVKQLFLKISEY